MNYIANINIVLAHHTTLKYGLKSTPSLILK